MSKNIILIIIIFVFWLFISFTRKKSNDKKQSREDGIMKTPQIGDNTKTYV